MGKISFSSPLNGTYFDVGEQITITVTVTDSDGQPVDIDSTNLSSDRFYIYGPLDQSRTVTCQGLMNTAGPREYVHLEGPHPGLTVSGNVATFVTGAVTTEEPGTYRAVARLRSAFEEYDRDFVIQEFQIGTATVETETVALTECAACHKGADNGHHYFHHSDSSSGPGSYEYDDLAVASCKTCHNQNGYAVTTDSWDPARPQSPDPIIRRVHGIHMGAELLSPRNTHRMALASATPDVVGGFDPTVPGKPDTTPVRLIHGVTSGAEARVHGSDGSTWLALGHVTGEFLIGETVQVMAVPDLTRWTYSSNWPANRLGIAVVGASTIYGSSGSTNVAVAEGYFADYTTVEFPADVRNCILCHVDDRWKERPSQYACGACHDNIWWGDATLTPEGFEDHPFEIADIKNGVPGAEHDVSLCDTCHTEGGLVPVSASHTVPEFVEADQETPATQAHTIELALDPPPPVSGYAVGDMPKVYVTVKDAGGVAVDPATITEAAWRGLSLYVSGPRSALATPVLTTAAAGKQASVTNGTSGPWNLSGDPTFVLSIDGAPATVLTALAANFTTPASASAAEVVAWLNSEPAFNTVAKARVSAGKVNIRNKPGVATSGFEILPSAVATAMGWTVGVTLPSGSTTGNDLRIRTDAWDADPRVVWNSGDHRIEYQLDDVAGLTPGTYAMYVDGYMSSRPEGFALLTFQVGTATTDAYIATNCSDCHGIKHMHLDAGGRHPVEFDTDYCKNCHDYRSEGPNADVWSTYGADPIVKKVHGLHRGKYLTYPDRVYPNNPKWSGIVFPQDIRNCTKCHSSDTTGTWKTSPSRMACGACHDSDAAETHMLLQTYDPTPVYDPVTRTGGAWSGDEVESCVVCHGEGRDYAVETVHDVTDPYVPPGPR